MIETTLMVTSITVETVKTLYVNTQSPIIIDPLLARVVREEESSFGLNNITVESMSEEDTISFESNGTQVPLSPPNNNPVAAYVQSTPTARGQFERFLPREI